MLFPYLAVTFTALFWSLPRKCSQFCSLELNYSKHLSPSSSTLIFLGFSKEGLSSWRWLKLILRNEHQSAQTGQGPATEDEQPHTVWLNMTRILSYSIPHNWDTQASKVSGRTPQSSHFWNISRAVSMGTTNPQPQRAFNTQAQWLEKLCHCTHFSSGLRYSVTPGCHICISLPNFNHSAWNNPAGWQPGLRWVGCSYF